MVNYKVCLKENSDVQFDGLTYTIDKDIWSTVKLEDGATDGAIKYAAKKNLMVNVARYYFGNANLWKHIYIDNSDIQVVR